MPGTSHQYGGNSSASVVSAQLGRAALIGIFPLAEIGKWIVVKNVAEYIDKVGPKPAVTSACFNDWWNGYVALKNAEYGGKCYLTLMIWNTAHYTDYTDPDTLTATQSSIGLLDSDGTVTLTLRDKRYGESDLQVKVLAGSSDSTAYFDLEVYVANSGKTERVNNCNMDSTSSNYVVTRVGTRRKWEVIDVGTGNRPANVTTAVSLDDDTDPRVTVGDNGWTSLDTNDLLGTESVKGNTGIYALSSVLHTLEKPEYIFIPHKFPVESDTITMLRTLETWGLNNNIIPVIAGHENLSRTDVADMRKGTGSYSTPFGNSIGGTIMVHPWGSPPELMTSQDTSTGKPKRISPEGDKIGALARVIGIKWIEEAAAGMGGYGKSYFSELEYDTDDDDSDYLDPLGIQVIRTDLGMIYFGHGTLSSDPDFFDETARRLDNFAIISIDVSTMSDVHRKIPPRKMRAMARKIRRFFRNMFKYHQDAFKYDTFDRSVFVDVEGQNDLNSDDYDAGKIYTAWDTAWAPSINTITHKYSHELKRTTVTGSK